MKFDAEIRQLTDAVAALRHAAESTAIADIYAAISTSEDAAFLYGCLLRAAERIDANKIARMRDVSDEAHEIVAAALMECLGRMKVK